MSSSDADVSINAMLELSSTLRLEYMSMQCTIILTGGMAGW